MAVTKYFLLMLFLSIIVLISNSCGKKGDLTLKTFEKPAIAENLRALHRDNEIYISWNYPVSERPKIKGCQLLRSDANNTDYRELAFLNINELFYIDRDFDIGLKYYYKIRCLSLRNIYSEDSSVIEVVPLQLLPKPEDISYILLDDSIRIQWQEIPDAKYNIYKSPKKGSYSINPLNKTPIKENFFIDVIDTKKVFYYTVRSLHGSEIRDESPASEEIEVNPADFTPSAPLGLKYAPLEKRIYLIWQKNPEIWVKGYRIYRKRHLETNFSLIGESISPVFIDSEPLSMMTTYYITALGPKKESLASKSLDMQIE